MSQNENSIFIPKVLSLFSGVGGFDLGLERAGMETVFQCEWDKHAIKILERHWPKVPRWTDISTLTGAYVLDHAPTIDIVAWGSPCQDLSAAGKRVGLSGKRSGLFHEGVRIIKEIREITNGKYPKLSIWENVYGALSSNKGADFNQVLYEMAEAGALEQEWRVLDAQYFGVPQRRRRVFLVSVFDPTVAKRCPDPLFPFPEGVSGHIEKGSESIKNPSDSLGGSPTEGSCTDKTTIGSNEDSKTSVEYDEYNSIIGPLAASDWKFPQQQQVYEGKIVLYKQKDTRSAVSVLGTTAHTLTSRMDSSEDGYGRGTPIVAEMQNNNPVVRKLTPIECERLMGWPDDWTCGQADIHRYTQCGNGVASPVATWIAQILIPLL